MDTKDSLREIYYYLKPIIPKRCQIGLRRQQVHRKRSIHADTWPVDAKAGCSPYGWPGWPEGKKFAMVLTHDVETTRGLRRCYQLSNLEMEMGFRSSYNFVAEGYASDEDLRKYLTDNGFEIGLHGLRHRGNLFKSKRFFLKQVPKINNYLKKWQSVGFRTPSMYHELEWLHELEIEYDSSTFDTDPYEPQPDGVGTIFPFVVRNDFNDRKFTELPYTLPQDHTLFVLLREKDISIWKNKLDWIAECGGMALLIAHPDYMSFAGKGLTLDEYPVEFYSEFLDYILSKYSGQYWHALPKEIARFFMEKWQQLEKDIVSLDNPRRGTDPL